MKSGRGTETQQNHQSCPVMELSGLRSECCVGRNFRRPDGSSLIRSIRENVQASGFGPQCSTAPSDPESQWVVK